MLYLCEHCTCIFASVFGSVMYSKCSIFRTHYYIYTTCNTCVKRLPQKTGYQDQLSLNAGQNYCRILQGEHSAILSTYIKLPFVIKIFVLSIFEWPFYTGYKMLVIRAGIYEMLSRIANTDGTGQTASSSETV